MLRKAKFPSIRVSSGKRSFLLLNSNSQTPWRFWASILHNVKSDQRFLCLTWKWNPLKFVIFSGVAILKCIWLHRAVLSKSLGGGSGIAPVVRVWWARYWVKIKVYINRFQTKVKTSTSVKRYQRYNYFSFYLKIRAGPPLKNSKIIAWVCSVYARCSKVKVLYSVFL